MSVLAPLGPPSQLPAALDRADGFAVSIPPLRPAAAPAASSSPKLSSTVTATATAPHNRVVSASLPPRDVPSSQVYTTRSSSSSYTSTSTMSTVSMQRQPTSSSSLSNLPRRSTSGRSAASNSPTSYVALMRKQKATVWCDRSQSIEPNTAAARKKAKELAMSKVSNGLATGASARTATLSSSGVVGKIRHGGVPKAPGYVGANMSGAGVPLRLSANEMLGDEEEERSFISGDNAMVHGRSGSGKSSTSSAKYRSGYPRADQARFSGGTSPIGGDNGSPASRDRILEEESTAATAAAAKDHHALHNTDEEAYGELKDLAAPNSLETRTDQSKKVDDLRRRGSVDERAMTMGSTVKLFVANPDIDSD